MTQQYIGLDVHKNYTKAVVLDEKGNMLQEQEIYNQPAEYDKFISSIDKNAKMVMEACSCWQHIYDYFDDAGFDLTLAHPLRVKAIASARIKTDKIDAKILANLLRADFIPACYVPPHYIRKERNMTRHRLSLVHTKTQIKNKIHAILLRHGINYEFSDAFGKLGKQFLYSLDLPEEDRFAMDNYLNTIEFLDNKIQETEEVIEELAKKNPQARLIMSMPGIGYFSSVLIMSEIGDFRRFPNGKKLTSYAGLVPSVYQSGNTLRHGRITKQGSSYLRWIMTQCAVVGIQKDERLREIYNRIRERRGNKAAIVAVARKMLIYIYKMLQLNITYDALQKNRIRRDG